MEAMAEVDGWRDSDKDRWLELRKKWFGLEEQKRGMLSQKAKVK